MNPSLPILRRVSWSLLALSLVACLQAELLLELTFNDSGPETQMTERSGWDWGFDFQTQEGDPVDGHGPPGSGVSGLAADRAFDNSVATGMGSGESGRRLLSPSQTWPILDSITWSGWFKTEERSIGSFARLFFWEGSNQLFSFIDGTLTVAIGGSSIWSAEAYHATNDWVFFAVTYDGTESTDNLRFYRGGVDEPITLVDTKSYDRGPFSPPGWPLCIGNNLSYNTPTQPFDGWLDNMRIHGGAESSGALPPGDLENLRSADLAGSASPIRIRTHLDLNPADPPANGPLRFEWWSIIDHRYRLLQSTDMAGWNPVIGTDRDGDGSRLSLEIDPPATTPLFYRLEIEPLP